MKGKNDAAKCVGQGRTYSATIEAMKALLPPGVSFVVMGKHGRSHYLSEPGFLALSVRHSLLLVRYLYGMMMHYTGYIG